jgi:AAA domain
VRTLGLGPHLLDTQYRMHPAIAEFPNAAFYGERLRDAVTVQDRRAPAGLPWPDVDRPVVFVECRCAARALTVLLRNSGTPVCCSSLACF